MSSRIGIQIFVLFFLVMFIGQPVFPVCLQAQAAGSGVSRELVDTPVLNSDLLKNSDLKQINQTAIASIDGLDGTSSDNSKSDYTSVSSGNLDLRAPETGAKKKVISLSNISKTDLNTSVDTLIPDQSGNSQERASGSEKEPPVEKAVITNFTYQFTRDVVPADLSGITIANDGILKIPNDKYEIGDVLVDQNVDAAIKIIGNSQDGGRIVRQAEIGEIFEKFDLPDQDVQLREGNIQVNPELKPYLVKDTKARSIRPAGELNGLIATNAGEGEQSAKLEVDKRIAKFDPGHFTFESPTIVTGADEDGGSVKVKFQGEIGVAPTLHTRYTLMKGYGFTVGGAEKFKLTAKIIGNAHKRAYIYLYGIDVPLVGLGKVQAGLYLVVDIDGNFSIVVRAEQGAFFDLTISGGTFLGVPTSLHFDTNSGSYSGSSFDPEGQVKIDVLIAVHIELRLLGMNVLEGELAGGVSGYGEVLKDKSRMKFGISLVVTCDLYVLGEGGNILSKSWTIFASEKATPPKYAFYTSDFDAFTNTIKGKVVTAETNAQPKDDESLDDPYDTKVPYQGQVHIEYYPAAGGMVPVDVPSNSDGIFSYTFPDSTDVIAGDSVVLSVGDSKTEPIPSSFPFKRVILTQAEFYEDTVIGYVEPAMPLSIPGVVLPKEETSLLHYSGPVKILVQKNGQTMEYVLPNITSDSFQGPVLGREGDEKITPGSFVQAVAFKDGFEVPSVAILSQNPISFTKWYKTNTEVPAGSAVGYLNLPMIHHMENHFTTLNTNPLGTKPLTEPIDIAIQLGKVAPDLNINLVHIMDEDAPCDTNILNYFGYDFYENSRTPLPTVLYEIKEKSNMKPEWATNEKDSPLVAGTNVYWAYEVDGPYHLIKKPDPGTVDISLVKRSLQLSDMVKEKTDVIDLTGGTGTSFKKVDPTQLQGPLTPRVGPILSTEQQILETMPEYTVNAPTDVWEKPYFDDESRVTSQATYVYEGTIFSAKYLFTKKLWTCPPKEQKDDVASRELQKTIEMIKNHDFRGLWLYLNKERINPDTGGPGYLSLQSENNQMPAKKLIKLETGSDLGSVASSLSS